MKLLQSGKQIIASLLCSRKHWSILHYYCPHNCSCLLQRERVIIHLNCRNYCPYCWLPIEKVPAFNHRWNLKEYYSEMTSVIQLLPLTLLCFLSSSKASKSLLDLRNTLNNWCLKRVNTNLFHYSVHKTIQVQLDLNSFVILGSSTSQSLSMNLSYGKAHKC